MRLEPVQFGEDVALRDEDAAPPKGLPDRDEQRSELRRLRRRMRRLQRALFAERKQALLVVLQARDAGGKDGTIRRIFGALNPQGCTVTGFGPPTELELRHDFLWRVHQAVPPTGKIGIFNRSHYEDVLVVRVRELAPREVWTRRFEHIVAFERLLHDSRVKTVKFLLHISRDEQRRRLIRRLEDPSRNWKFDPGDLDDRRHWDEYSAAYRETIARTSTADAPWYVVPADDKRVRNYLVARVVVDALEAMDPQYPEAAELVERYLGEMG